MVFYANSSSYDALVAAARDVAGEIRKVVATLPGKALSEQRKPMRTEKHYRKYKGDGPARMMAKFRTFEKSQLLIESAAADQFAATVEKVTTALAADTVSDASDTTGWETITKIPLRDDAVYIGLTNLHRRQDDSNQLPFPWRFEKRLVTVSGCGSRRGFTHGGTDRQRRR
jgi:hypothetical protein